MTQTPKTPPPSSSPIVPTDAITQAHLAAAAKVHGHGAHDVRGRLTVLLTHVNDVTDEILTSGASDADKVALLKAFVASNRATGIAEIISLSGAA
jgi:hypothetical protein